MNNLININDLKAPGIPYLDDRIYLTIDRKYHKERNYYFMKNRMFTDQSFIGTDYEEEESIMTYENNYDDLIVDVDNGGTELLPYCSIYFRSNYISKSHYRTFEKIWKFLSFVGGVWSLLFMVFSFVGSEY